MVLHWRILVAVSDCTSLESSDKVTALVEIFLGKGVSTTEEMLQSIIKAAL